MLKGIDVSSHNGQPFNGKTERAFAESDFCIVKTTQALSYVNSCANYALERTFEEGKLAGFYHYAGGWDPVAEADYFIKHSAGYFERAIPVLDWESYENRAWGNVTWCKVFCNRVHDVTGVWPMIYIQASALDQAANCADDCALWIAGYPTDTDSWAFPSFPYNTYPWPAYTVWQYSSSGGTLDRNVSFINEEQWEELARGDNMTISNEDANRIAKAVWAVGSNEGFPTGASNQQRLNMIDKKTQEIKDQLTRTDTAGHDNPDGHDFYGRLQIIEHDIGEIAKAVDEIKKRLEKRA